MSIRRQNSGENGVRKGFCRPSLRILILPCILVAFRTCAQVETGGSYVSFKKSRGGFTLSARGRPATWVFDAAEDPGVQRALKTLMADIARVADSEPALSTDGLPASGHIVLAGTVGKSRVLDGFIRENGIDVSDLEGRREKFFIQVVEKPVSGPERALIIAGSDKRGTIYGLYDMAEEIGVSPWNWWADVPVEKHRSLYVKPGRHTLGEPAVRYRGIFINDEAPVLSGWAHEKFGGFNHLFYEKVFELILRLKGNFLWPAMWGRAFYADDTLNPKLADEYGIVIGTSHHEPMMRAHDEWRRFGKGEWNYDHNEETLRGFWEQGIRRMGSYESIVTLGMRGDGDMPMTEESNIALLERIVRDQRGILEKVTGRDHAEIPQVWALYKEVQDYYDKGMRVPDDVTLLLCDDNWGNVRKLPDPEEPPRAGGYGMYYHFDFVGGPRNYKWVNTNQISRIWEQMHLTYEHGVDRIWIVNVGDIKPMELPISFFLDMAWDPDRWTPDNLPEYTRQWAEQQFGVIHAPGIASILNGYTRFNSRRKPEMLGPDFYSLVNYREAETVVSEYNKLAGDAERIFRSLPAPYQDAFYQLVLYPVAASANLNDLWITVGKNRYDALQGRAATNDLAERARRLFAKDAELSDYVNRTLAGGKWSHMADQTHISYTYWQQPEKDVMPEVREIEIPAVQDMGVAIEGSEAWWPSDTAEAVLPEMDVFSKPSRYVEIFNRGSLPFDFSIKPEEPWIRVSPDKGKINEQERIWISVNWKKAPRGNTRVPVVISGPAGSSVTVHAAVRNPDVRDYRRFAGFIEGDGVVSMEAHHYSAAVESDSIRWVCIPEFGRTSAGMTPFPVTAPARVLTENSPCLEYEMLLFDKGTVEVHAYFSPTQNFKAGKGLRYAVSFDEEDPQTVNIHANDTIPDWKYPPFWNQAVGDNIKKMVTQHVLSEPGTHILKFWMIDTGIVLQKLVVDAGGLRPSYLGPPES
ncbi:glycosyl hydrolase 115 family protein, partial [bacterium]|nr:glycosyl hydrolase 115 family protein [bacterium]